MAAAQTLLRLIISGDSRGAQKAIKDVSGAAKGLDGAVGSATDRVSQRAGLIGEKMVGVGKSMTMGVTLPLVAMGALAVSSFAKFETSMNQVQAASGATAAQMAELSTYAKKMGADTVFSAGEAAAAMLELAKAGLTPAQIKAGALKATMDLAAAGGLELAEAANVTSNAMHMFALKATDAASIAAALAGGANASTAEVGDLALAMQQVGPGARTMGLSLQETVAVLAMFADKGIRGSDAGTSLKTMLTRLVPTTKKATKLMADLGLSFVNSKGEIDDISIVAEKLRDKLGGLTQEQQSWYLAQIFGSDATRAATILMEGGAKAVDKYTLATSNQNAATDMANARMKGLGGSLENMKGSVESLGITFGEILAPAIRTAAGAVKWLADTLAGMPGWLQKVVVSVAVLAAALGPLLVITGKVLTGFQAIRNFTFARSVAAPGVGGGTVKPGVGGLRAIGAGGVAQTNANTAAEQRNTMATNANTAAQQRSTRASNLDTGADQRSTAASNMDTAADRRSAAASNLSSAADRRQASSSAIAGSRVGALGNASGRARGSILGMDKASVKSAAGLAGLAIALTFTLNQLSKLGNAIDSLDAAAKQAGQARTDADKTLDMYMAKVASKYGKDSPQYAAALRYEKEQRAAIARDAYKKPWWATAASSVKGGASRAWNFAFGGGQASGGDYMVNRPTLFLAGEAGRERATFTPQGRSGPGGLTVNVNIANVHGTDGAAAQAFANKVASIVAQRQRMVAATGY